MSSYTTDRNSRLIESLLRRPPGPSNSSLVYVFRKSFREFDSIGGPKSFENTARRPKTHSNRKLTITPARISIAFNSLLISPPVAGRFIFEFIRAFPVTRNSRPGRFRVNDRSLRGGPPQSDESLFELKWQISEGPFAARSTKSWRFSALNLTILPSFLLVTRSFLRKNRCL